MSNAPIPKFVRKPSSSGSWLYNARLRELASQALVLVLLAWGLYEIVSNTQANLKHLNQNFGFDFLSQAANFDILSSIISYSSSSTFGRALLVGFWNTLLVAACGIVLATLIGFIGGIMRLSKNAVVSGAAALYVDIVRSVPLLLQIFMWYALVLKPLPGPKQAFNFFNALFISNRGVIGPRPEFGDGSIWALVLFVAAIVASFFLSRYARKKQELTGQRIPAGWISFAMVIIAPLIGLALAGWPLTWDIPSLTGFNFSGGMTLIPEFLALLLALSVYTGTFITEIVRAGIQAVSRGQTEASQALGLTHGTTLRLVIIPQALRIIIPPLANQYLNLTKNSTLAIAIGFPDLVATGGTILNQSGKAIEIVSVWMVVYLSLSLITSAFMNWYNSRMKLVSR
ncbi:MAG: amino acid ABC transporter permease [Pseudomonadota bacterium]|nr:amino acid ABC transporter permease [Pseudomonadota bacterium]